MTCFSRGGTARHRRRLVGAVLPVALLVPVAACSSSDAPDGTAAAPVPTASVEAARAGGPPSVENATDLTRKPVAAAGKGAAPGEILVQDLVTGEGAAATGTSTVLMQYVGTIWKTGTEFDSSWDRGEAATFPLQNLIPGMGMGISGMKEGGRRLIVIPPALGYGPDGGRAPRIAADDSLVFVVDLLKVAPEDTAGGSAGSGA